MKVRLGFVTNSSSSSFVIAKKSLTEMQIEAIKHHIELAEKIGIEKFGYADSWCIDESENFIAGDTYMDNFSMSSFLDYIGVPKGAVNWREYGAFDLEALEGEKTKTEEDNSEWESMLEEMLGEERQ